MDEELPASDRRPRNPYLVALWVLGGVTTALGLIGITSSQYLFASNSFNYAGNTPPVTLVIAQVAANIAPSMLTSGILCVALALAVNALGRNGALEVVPVEHEPREDIVGSGAPGAHAHPAPPAVAPLADSDSLGSRSRDYRPPTTDHERFMRPSR